MKKQKINTKKVKTNFASVQSQTAITLVALVVTIIVLLILAGVSLSLIAGSNGIISKSENAVFEHQKGEDKEILELAYGTLYIESKTENKEISKDALKEELTNTGKDVSVEDKQGDNNKLIVINKDTGNAYELDKETGEVKYIGSYTGKYEDIEITEGDIIFETTSTSEWSIENVAVDIKVNEDIDMTYFELQVSKDGKKWEPYIGEITLTETTTIYTKVVDKITGQAKATASIEVKIDKERPAIVSTSSTTNKITFTAIDNESGIVGYAVSTSNTEPAVWTECEKTKSLVKTEAGKTQETTYYIWVKDEAGNISEPKTIATEKLSTISNNDLEYATTWNGTDVTVNFTTTSGFDIEISTDGVNWEKTTSKTVPTGTQIYVRYTDGTNHTEKFAAVKPLWTGTITYNVNGGTGSVPTAQSAQHTTTVTVNFATLPTRTGYTFAGWNTKADGTGTNYTQSATKTFTMGTNNVVLYAKWTANTNTAYKVVHQQMNVSGSGYTVITTENLTGTTGATITPAVKTYTGFTSPSTQTTTIAADGSTTVTYSYTRNKYTFTLGSGTGVSTSGSAASGSYYYGATIKLKATASTGYTWKQWTSNNTSLVASTTTASTTFTMPAGAITMTPSATINSYTVTYNANGGSGAPVNQTKTYGVTLTLSSTKPTRVGYTFLGWSTSNTATSATYASGGNYTGNANLALYAVWKDIDPLYLYNNGSINSAAGDFVVAYGANDVVTAKGSFTKYSSYLDLRRNIVDNTYANGQFTATGFLSTKAVDVSNYKTLTFTYKTTSYMTSTSDSYKASAVYDMGLSSYTSSNSSSITDFINGAEKRVSTSSEYNSTTYLDSSYDIDITNVTGSWHVGGETIGSMWRGMKWYIYCTSIYLH